MHERLSKLPKIMGFVFITVLIVLIVRLRNSYAIFEDRIEGTDVNFVVGKLDYSFILEEEIKKGILIKAGEYKVVQLELTSTNDVTSKYAFVYKTDTAGNVSIGYIKSDKYPEANEAEGTINSGETKEIYLGLHNTGKESRTIEISVIGGLEKNNLVATEGYTKIESTATDTYEENILNGTNPVLGKDMIPVTIDDDGTVRYASLYSEWYKYAEKRWANAVILVGEPSNEAYKVGDIIVEKDIESYFVWVPRYRYKLWNLGEYTTYIDWSAMKDDITEATGNKDTAVHNMFGGARLIDIVFETKENATTNKEATTENTGECATPKTSGDTGNCKVGYYMTHPAFLAFNTNGFWVGKFETGYNQNESVDVPIENTANWTKAKVEENVDAVDSSKILVKPGVPSWRNVTVGNIFRTALEYKKDLQSHMMKNTEWGAVAYLSHSAYGIGTEVRINNNSSYLTGYASAKNLDQSSNPGTSGNTLVYTQPYNTTIGYLASTTGNITGIYDMSGCAIEYMAAYRDTSGTTLSGLTEQDLIQYETYLDKYSDSSIIDSYNQRILGDATGEMGPFYSFYDKNGTKRSHNAWYSNYSYFVQKDGSWFQRGGSYGDGILAGQFNFTRSAGGTGDGASFRLVLSPQ